MTQQTQSQLDRDVRTVYVAIDAVQRLCDRGRGCLQTERAFSALRELQNHIECTPIKSQDMRKEQK